MNTLVYDLWRYIAREFLFTAADYICFAHAWPRLLTLPDVYDDKPRDREHMIILVYQTGNKAQIRSFGRWERGKTYEKWLGFLQNVPLLNETFTPKFKQTRMLLNQLFLDTRTPWPDSFCYELLKYLLLNGSVGAIDVCFKLRLAHVTDVVHPMCLEAFEKSGFCPSYAVPDHFNWMGRPAKKERIAFGAFYKSEVEFYYVEY